MSNAVRTGWWTRDALPWVEPDATVAVAPPAMATAVGVAPTTRLVLPHAPAAAAQAGAVAPTVALIAGPHAAVATAVAPPPAVRIRMAAPAATAIATAPIPGVLTGNDVFAPAPVAAASAVALAPGVVVKAPAPAAGASAVAPKPTTAVTLPRVPAATASAIAPAPSVLTQPLVVASLNSGTYSSTRSPTTGTIAGYTPVLNDLVVLVLALPQSGAITVTAPANWTAVTFGANAYVPGTSSGTAGSMVILYHYVTAAEVTAGTTAWTLTNVLGTAKGGRRYVAVLRGVDAANPVDSAAGNAGSSAALVIPGVTPTVTEGLVLGFGQGNTTSASETITTLTSPWALVVGQMSGTSQVGFIAKNSTGTAPGVLVAGQSLALNRSDDWIGAAVTFRAAAA